MKKVALALSSGGPRGFAYIGAIEELLARGYEITSIAGTSAGSLVGGIYAAGGLDAFKEWLYGLDPVKVVSLMDFSISKNYLVKGERVIRGITERVPLRPISIQERKYSSRKGPCSTPSGLPSRYLRCSGRSR